MKYFFVTFIPKFFKGFAIFAPAIKKYPQKEKEQKKNPFIRCELHPIC